MMGSLARDDDYDPFEAEKYASPLVGGLARATGNVISGLARDIPAAGRWFLGQAAKPEAEAQADVRGVMGGLATQLGTLPERAIGASQSALDTGVYNPAPAVETVLTAAGGALPWAEKGAAGVFGGRLAQGADLNALKLAEDMAGRNASPYKIRQATGWFQGPDAKWRFEIPDTASKWRDTPDQFTNVTASGLRPHDSTAALGDIFEHPELYAAYPQIAKADVNISHAPGNIKGSYQTGGEGSPATLTLGARDPAGMRSTALHEIQHGIQDIEGFATGGNTFGLHTGSPGWKLYEERLKAIQTPATEKHLTESGVLGPEYTYADYLKEHRKIMRDPVQMQRLDRAAQDYAVQEGYKRLAGEVEARNVQTRADWTPGRLKNVPPWSETSQDVPYNKQFIKYPRPDVIEGPQLSHDPTRSPEMGFGTATPGTFKNWLLRYSPESGAPELVNASGPTGSVFSSIKSGT